MRRADRLTIEEIGLPGPVLMENAGRGVTDKLCELGIGGPVVICCGKGNNAGDGFVIAQAYLPAAEDAATRSFVTDNYHIPGLNLITKNSFDGCILGFKNLCRSFE